jgi:hypothetical protein
MRNTGSVVRAGWWLLAGLGIPSLALTASPCAGFREAESRRLCSTLAAGQPEWHLHLGGASVHAKETQAPGRKWNERHAGFGLESRTPGLPWRDRLAGDRWQTSYSLGTFADSRNVRSMYTGAAFTHQVLKIGSMRLDAGAGAFLFYKSKSWNGNMALMPGILPVLSYSDRNAPYGFNIIWRPPEGDASGTLFMQITHRFQ